MDLFANFESINLRVHPSQTWQMNFLSFVQQHGNLENMKVPRFACL